MPVQNLPLHRRLTRSFITANPVDIVLTPRTREKQPAGGWAWVDGTPRDPQTMTLIEQTASPRLQVTADGVDREVEFVLLGEWDSSMDAGDVFTHQGKTWEVVEMFYDNGYEKRGMVAGRG